MYYIVVRMFVVNGTKAICLFLVKGAVLFALSGLSLGDRLFNEVRSGETSTWDGRHAGHGIRHTYERLVPGILKESVLLSITSLSLIHIYTSIHPGKARLFADHPPPLSQVQAKAEVEEKMSARHITVVTKERWSCVIRTGRYKQGHPIQEGAVPDVRRGRGSG